MRLPLFAAAAMLVTPSLAIADTYDYNFLLTSQGRTEAAFTLTSPNLAVSDVGLLTTTCYEPNYGNYPCYAVVLLPERGYIDIYTNRTEATGYSDIPADFFQVGDHLLTTYYLGNLQLNIVDIPNSAQSTTPEPSSLGLLAFGAIFVGAVIRRKPAMKL